MRVPLHSQPSTGPNMSENDDTESTLLELPQEMIQNCVSFMNLQNCLSFKTTCRVLHNDLSLFQYCVLYDIYNSRIPFELKTEALFRNYTNAQRRTFARTGANAEKLQAVLENTSASENILNDLLSDLVRGKARVSVESIALLVEDGRCRVDIALFESALRAGKLDVADALRHDPRLWNTVQACPRCNALTGTVKCSLDMLQEVDDGRESSCPKYCVLCVGDMRSTCAGCGKASLFHCDRPDHTITIEASQIRHSACFRTCLTCKKKFCGLCMVRHGLFGGVVRCKSNARNSLAETGKFSGRNKFVKDLL